VQAVWPRHSVSVHDSRRYYRDKVAAIGGRTAADDFSSYFVAPGVSHCHGALGAVKSDLLMPLKAGCWRARHLAAPKNASAPSPGFTRRLCPCPRVRNTQVYRFGRGCSGVAAGSQLHVCAASVKAGGLQVICFHFSTPHAYAPEGPLGAARVDTSQTEGIASHRTPGPAT
jgi:hypothetical protein